MKEFCGLAISLLTMTFGATGSAETEPLPRVVPGREGVVLRDWWLLGPFEAGPKQAALETDFLATLGQAESVRNGEILVNLASRLATRHGTISGGVHHMEFDWIDFSQLYARSHSSDDPETATYAACEIVADSRREAWLLLGSSDGAKVWLNGELLHEKTGQRALMLYDDAVRLPLKAGANVLLVKVSNIEGGWSMAARLEPDAAQAALTALARSVSVLKRSVIPEDESLESAVIGLPETILLDARITDSHGAQVRTMKLGARQGGDLKGLSCGLYQVRVSLSEHEHLDAAFVLGSLAATRQDLAERCRLFLEDDRVAINLQALLRRLEILDASEPRSSRLAQWRETNLSYALRALMKALDRLASGEEAFRQQTGTHLRGFRSEIDDQVFHYRLVVPSNYDPEGPGLPLVIIMQTVFQANRPYLESAYLSNPNEAEEWRRLAEKLGIGVLWTGYRISPYGNPADLGYFDEVLKTVASDYRLDFTRLYLHGSCSAGLTTSMEALRHPERYAALAYLNPVLHRVKNRFDDSGKYAGNATYRAWLQRTDPVAGLAALPDMPIWIIHDGVDPDHGPLSHSVDFVGLARALGHPPRFHHSRGSQEPRMAIWERQIRWLLTHRRASAESLTFAPPPPDGPLSRVFADRFVVVRGTGGSEAEKAASAHWYQEFMDAWQRTNYVPCRVIDDVDLRTGEERASHLVLIGNPRTNLVWQQMAEQMGVKVTPTGVSLGNQTWPGETLALQAWREHPKYPGRRIVFIGASDLERSAVGTMELALDGWFDYAVWQAEAGRTELIASGSFRDK